MTWLSPSKYFCLIAIASLLLLLSACGNQPRKVPVTLNCIQKHLLTAAEVASIRKEIHATEKAASLDSLFQKKHDRQGFNGAVLVAQKGIILYENVFGYRNFASKEPLCLNSAFQLASISKTFTGVAVLLLIQEGKIKLTDSVQQYLPGFPYHGISIQDLLSHRSGLPNYRYVFEDKSRLSGPFPNNDSILNWFREAKPLPPVYSKPGCFFSYSNTNFIVLASILEKVSGMKYADFIRTRIFTPLEMRHSYIDSLAPDSLLKMKTTGYNGNRPRERDFYDGVYGDKAVFSTVEDMARWYFALHNECLLNKYWLKQAFTPRSFEKKGRHNYGLGFRIMTDPSNMEKAEYVYHGGWWAGYSTMFWTSPSKDYVIIVLGNKRSGSVYDVKPVIEILEQNGNADEDTSSEAGDSL